MTFNEAGKKEQTMRQTNRQTVRWTDTKIKRISNIEHHYFFNIER